MPLHLETFPELTAFRKHPDHQAQFLPSLFPEYHPTKTSCCNNHVFMLVCLPCQGSDPDFPGVSRTDVICHLTKGLNKCNAMYIKKKPIIIVTKGKTKPNQKTQGHASVLWLPHSIGPGDETLNDGSSTDTQHLLVHGVLSFVVFYEQILAGGSCRVPLYPPGG